MAFGAAGFILADISMRCNITRHARMAFHAIVLQILQIGFGDADRLRIILKRESFGMIPAVSALNDKFLRDRMWHVTVIAIRRLVMAAPLPRIIILSHRMTIDTCLGVIAKIRKPFGIIKSKQG